MSTSLAYHTQGIVGFQHEAFNFSGGLVAERLTRQSYRCPSCNSPEVRNYPIRTRLIQGLPYGSKPLFLEVTVHRLYCPKCGKAFVEKLPFLFQPKSRITLAMERTLVELRADMSITALSKYFKVPWHTIKAVEKRHLQKKYKHIRLKEVKIIGMDEIAIGKDDNGKTAYWTIVRDLSSGAVLHVDRGKSGDSLKGFLKRLRHSKAKIEVVAMDMGKAFIKWVSDNLPNAHIVFDHFHVIKLMNERLNKVRKRVADNLDEEGRKVLKQQRFTLLRNEEDLKPEAAARLEKIKEVSEDLGVVHMMKEALRSIYRVAQDSSQAETALNCWCNAALQTAVPELHRMVKTLRSHWKGILGFWTFGGVTNAAMEGFNNKVRNLVRQAYGFRDYEYMKLKIFDLPNNRIGKEI